MITRLVNKWVNKAYIRFKRVRSTSRTPHLDDYLKRCRVHSETITINNDVVIVNGKKLEPGTPEYARAKKIANDGLTAGMKGMEAGMKTMEETIKDIFDVRSN